MHISIATYCPLFVAVVFEGLGTSVLEKPDSMTRAYPLVPQPLLFIAVRLFWGEYLQDNAYGHSVCNSDAIYLAHSSQLADFNNQGE